MSTDAGPRPPLRVAVLASGGGTNLQALLDRFNAAESPLARVALVISDRQDAGALERAGRADVPVRVIPTRQREPVEVAWAMQTAFEEHGIGLVALAGYLRLVPGDVVRRYRDRIINVHPALLPAFGGDGFYGRRVHDAVLASGATVTGPTVHLVDEEYDRGRILAQWPVPVLAGDTAATLSARVLAVEHVLYPAVVEAIAVTGGGVSAIERLSVGVRGRETGAGADRGVVGFGLTDRAPTIEEVRAALGLVGQP